MRTLYSVALLLFILASSLSAQQPSVDQIVARYAERVGGLDRIQSIRTLRRIGVFHGGGGFQADVRNENRRPSFVRQEFAFGGMAGITAYDGAVGWKIEPWGGKKDVETLSEDELRSIVEDAEFEDPLFDYKRKGNKVELLGVDQVEGTDVYKLRATLKSNGDIRTYYIDADSYVPIKIEVKRTVRGVEREYEVELGNYKSVDGWYLPFSVASGAKGSSTMNKSQIVWDTIEANVPLADQRFIRPGSGMSM